MDIFLATLLGLGTAVVLWRPFFGSQEEFVECIKFWFTPDAFSLIRGEHWEDAWAEFKLGVWMGLSALAGYGTFLVMQ